MTQQKILFICVHNSARSQMAEAFVNHFAGELFTAFSAGLQPGRLNPVVVEAMKEEGIDISQNRAKGVQEFLDKKEIFDYVVTVCDESQAEQCPVFPGSARRLHWGFEDPSGLAGSHHDKLQKTRIIRDHIKAKILSWLAEFRKS